jgi:hypothetical protein
LQQTELSEFYTKNSAGFTKKFRNISLISEAGFQLQSEQLSTGLSPNNEEKFSTERDLQNNLRVSSAKIYLHTEALYDYKKWKIRLRLPFSYQYFDAGNKNEKENRNLNIPAFEPTFLIQKEFGPFWKAGFSAGINRHIGGIDHLYPGYVLTNLRNLQRYEGPVSQSAGQRYRTLLSYQNPLQSIFGNLTYTFSNRRNNLLFDRQFDETGASTIKVIERTNFSKSHVISIRGSKYFSRINTSIKAATNYNLVQTEQLLNGKLSPLNNRTLKFNLGFDSEVTKWMTVAYSGDYGFSRAFLAGREINRIETQRHLMDVTLFPAENQYLELNSEFYQYSGNTGDLFMNLRYQYTFTKPKLDLSLHWNNIFNQKKFLYVHSNEHTLFETEYYLRPSQVLLSLGFSF